ncbi:MAG TPA: hypothetical protein VGA62_03110, partial [Acidimicrobiia bacterium]
PVLERLFPAAGTASDRLGPWVAGDGNRRSVRAVVRRGSVALATITACGAALVFAGSPARPGANTASPVARPRHATAVRLPPIDLDHNVATIDTKIDRAKAKQIAGDVVADFTTAAMAVAHGTPTLVQDAAAGPMFNDINLQAQMAAAGRVTVVRTYRFDHITVLVVRSKYQAGPQLGVETRGVVRITKYRDGKPTGGTGAARPFHRMYSLLPTDIGYKLYADVTDG